MNQQSVIVFLYVHTTLQYILFTTNQITQTVHLNTVFSLASNFGLYGNQRYLRADNRVAGVISFNYSNLSKWGYKRNIPSPSYFRPMREVNVFLHSVHLHWFVMMLLVYSECFEIFFINFNRYIIYMWKFVCFFHAKTTVLHFNETL